MIILKNYPFGGRPSKHYGGITIDKKTNIIGYRIGFIPKDYQPYPGEPIIVPMGEMDTFCHDLGVNIDQEVKKEHEPLKLKMAKWLAGDEIKIEQEIKKEPRQVKVGDVWVNRE